MKCYFISSIIIYIYIYIWIVRLPGYATAVGHRTMKKSYDKKLLINNKNNQLIFTIYIFTEQFYEVSVGL